MIAEKVIQIAIDSKPDVSRYVYLLTNEGRVFVGDINGNWVDINQPELNQHGN